MLIVLLIIKYIMQQPEIPLMPLAINMKKKDFEMLQVNLID